MEFAGSAFLLPGRTGDYIGFPVGFADRCLFCNANGWRVCFHESRQESLRVGHSGGHFPRPFLCVDPVDNRLDRRCSFQSVVETVGTLAYWSSLLRRPVMDHLWFICGDVDFIDTVELSFYEIRLAIGKPGGRERQRFGCLL
jgi:hypothetical protein